MSNKVSILIPNYNQSQFLPRAIQSCLMQTHANIEIIIADDNSTDDTEQVALEFTDSRVKYFKNSVNLGRVRNYHRALYEYATGDWVVNLDGDDFFTAPYFIEKALAELNTNPEAVLFFADFFETDNIVNDFTKLNKNYDGKVSILNGTRYLLSLPRVAAKIQHLTSVYKRSLALELGFYELDIISSDYASLYKLLPGNKIIHWNRVVGIWVKHKDNFSSTAKTQEKLANLQLFSSIRDFLIDFRNEQAQKQLSKISIRSWYVRNSLSYLRRVLFGFVWNPGTFSSLIPFFKLLLRIDGLLFLTLLFSPVTYILAIKRTLGKISKR